MRRIKMEINIENPNEFIIKKNLLWHHNLPLDDIGKPMDEARTEGYKEGQKDIANHIFAELDLKLMTQLHKVSDLKKDNPNTIWCIKEKDYNAIKKEHGVKVD